MPPGQEGNSIKWRTIRGVNRFVTRYEVIDLTLPFINNDDNTDNGNGNGLGLGNGTKKPALRGAREIGLNPN